MLGWQNPWEYFRCFAPDTGGGGDGGTGDAPPAGGGDDGDGGETLPVTYETWYAALDEAPKTLMDTHIAGLKSALNSQSEQRKALAKQLRDATGKLEKGSEVRKSLETMTAKLEIAEERLQFFEDAGKPEIGCSSPKLAYLAAKEGDFFDGRGNVNWTTLKENYPELFVKPKLAPASAGAGAGQTGGVKGTGMNAFIRAAAGRG